MHLLETQPRTISTALDEPAPITYGLDYYKPTMSQLAYLHEPDAEVTFTYHNRNPKQRLMDHVDPEELQERFDAIRDAGWDDAELRQLADIRINGSQSAFRPSYLDYLADNPLPDVVVRQDAEKDDIAIETTGPWALVSFWETQVMADVSETYFRNYTRYMDINMSELYNEGDRRLSEFTSAMRANPDIKFMEFGTRRRFSLEWQRHVLGRLLLECPDNLMGTSNVGLAREFGIPALGTIAHETDMVYTALAYARSGGDHAATRAGHQKLLTDQYDTYGEEYSTALTDTYTTNFFFRDFKPEQAAAWRALRQDSGNPFEFGAKFLDFYKSCGIDPATKLAVFSDALDTQKILDIHRRFERQLMDRYGIGTFLTNNLGLKAINQVMKATFAFDLIVRRGSPTVKRSDDRDKHTGPPELVNTFETIFDA